MDFDLWKNNGGHMEKYGGHMGKNGEPFYYLGREFDGF
jgi:hypothetical protein